MEPATVTLVAFAGGAACGLLAVAGRRWCDRQDAQAAARARVGQALHETAVRLRPSYRGQDEPFAEAYRRMLVEQTVLRHGLSMKVPVP